jgi:WD40 repeat protein
MDQQAMPNITLFDLLARSWQGRAAIDHLCFNSDDTLLAISSADGTIALARLADNEAPESRMAVDNGQTTMRPREGRPSPLIRTRIEGSRRLSAGPEGDFLVLTGDGNLLRVNRSGEIGGKLLADKSPIAAFDYCRRADLTSVIVNGRLRLHSARSGPIREVGLDGMAAEIIASSADGDRLALAGAGILAVRRTDGDCGQILTTSLPARPLSLAWSADGLWLACGLSSGGFCLIDVETERQTMLRDFPAPVASLGWSPSSNGFFASGAYRIAGWTIATPPFESSATGALSAGHAGFVIVNAIAAHPQKPLVAAGHVNGRITVARIGSTEELTIRDAGGPVTMLGWSSDGRHLAAGDALGSAAIITFPEQIFK